MTKEDIIYAAGFIDGEGCVTTSNGYNFRVTVSNTNKDILVWFQSVFGGNLNDQHLPKNPKHNIAWKWVICSKANLLTFLNLIIPYLHIKKLEAILVRDYLVKTSNRTKYLYTLYEKQEYQRVKIELRKLKTDLHWNRV